MALVVWSARNLKYNPFELPYRDFLLLGGVRRIFQKPGQAIGTVVWDSAYVICKYFEQHFPPNYFKNKKVLELGSGTGLLGLMLVLLGMHIR